MALVGKLAAGMAHSIRNPFTSVRMRLFSFGEIIVKEEIVPRGAGRDAVIYISDSGPGVTPPHRDKVFQPFFTIKNEGTGLGWSISRRIVSEHGGTLNLGMKQKTSATFIIALPIEESQP